MSAPPTVAPPPGHPRFPQVDGVRALAALLIFAYHIAYATHALQYGWAARFTFHLNVGVPIFFAISGFLLYRPFVAERHGAPPRTIWGYARNRVARILPGYWVALTTMAAVVGLTGVFTGDWWWFYGLLQVYSVKRQLLGLPVAWSLCVEVSFYALLPLYALALRRLAGTGRHWLRTELAVLAVLSVLSVLAFGRTQLSTILVTFPWFAVGMSFAVLSVAGKRPRIGGTALWAAGIALYVACCFAITQANTATWGLVTGYGALMAFTSAIAACVLAPAIWSGPGLPAAVLRRRPLAWLGLISYGLFLYHQPVLMFLQKHGLDHVVPGQDVLSLVVVAGPIAVALAAASYYLVERPALTLARRGERAKARRTPSKPGADAVAARL